DRGHLRAAGAAAISAVRVRARRVEPDHGVRRRALRICAPGRSPPFSASMVLIPPMAAIVEQLPRSNGSAADLANPLSQPALPKGDTFDGVNFGELKYRFFEGQASTGKYEYTDVIQGEIGDCFFLSSSVAINAVDSEFLGGHVENKPDGTHVI